MDKFLDAYQAWPPGNQLILLVVVLMLAFVLVLLAGWWLRSLLSEALHAFSVWLRGWPPGPAVARVAVAAEPLLALPPPDPRPEPRKEARRDARDPGRNSRRGAARRDPHPAQDDPPDARPARRRVPPDRLRAAGRGPGARPPAADIPAAFSVAVGPAEPVPGTYSHDTARGLM